MKTPMTRGDVLFLAVKPLSVKTTGAPNADEVILRVMRHNLREFDTSTDSRINYRHSCRNVILAGGVTAAAVLAEAEAEMRAADVLPRKNATLGIEMVVSLPASTSVDCKKYFADAAHWVTNHYGVHLLSAVCHFDEDHPHAHFLLLPIRAGKLVGSELLGDRATTKKLQVAFHEQVGKKYGLSLPAAQKRLGAGVRAAAMVIAAKALAANRGLSDAVLAAILKPHAADPAPLLEALGLPMPSPAQREATFTEIMTAKQTPIRTFKKTLIGHLSSEKPMSYALLGHFTDDATIPSAKAPS